MYTGILVSSNLHLCRLAVYFQMSFFWGLMDSHSIRSGQMDYWASEIFQP
jgi:hypothetical protein